MNPDEVVCREYALEVMGKDWGRKINPGDLSKVSALSLKMRTDMHKKLINHVTDVLENSDQLKLCKRIAGQTFVFAWGLQEQKGIVNTVMTRFYLEDDQIPGEVRLHFIADDIV